MKRLKLFLSLALSLLLLALPISALASGEEGIEVYDRAGLLTPEQEALLSGFRDPHGTRLCLVTGSSQFSSSEIKRICDIGRRDSAIVLAIDRAYPGATYYYEMFTYGHADKLLSQDACDAILDSEAVYYAIKNGKLFDGAAVFFSRSSEALSAVWREPTPLWQSTLITALVVGALAGGGTALGIYLYYRKKRRGVSYPLDRYAKLQLTEANDFFVGKSVTRVRVQSSSGSSGGRGSGGGSRGRR